MELNEAKDKFILKTTIKCGDNDYITLREPTSREVIGFGEDSQKNIEIIQTILPACIIEHTFTNNGEPAKNKEVAEFILSSTSLFSHVVQEWMNRFVIDEKKKES